MKMNNELEIMEKSPFVVKEGETSSLKHSIGYLLQESDFTTENFEVVLKRAPNQVNGYLADKVGSAITKSVPKLHRMNITKTGSKDFGIKYKNKHLDVRKPVRLENYENEIPDNVLDRIYRFENADIVKDSKLLEDFQLNYYVADVVDDPDPILFVQLGGMKELTFFVGAWE